MTRDEEIRQDLARQWREDGAGCGDDSTGYPRLLRCRKSIWEKATVVQARVILAAPAKH